MKTFTLACLILFANTASAQVPVTEGPTDNLVRAVEVAADSVRATVVAGQFLHLMYDVKLKDITAQPTEITGAVAVVLATIPGQKCELHMLKNPAANEHGWVVQRHQCKPAPAGEKRR